MGQRPLETITNVKNAIELVADLVAITWYLVDGKWSMLQPAVKTLREDLKKGGGQAPEAASSTRPRTPCRSHPGGRAR
ncbi:hypothetical protein FDZ71_11970 [bacterium]|nr:MAG: hypothetical protein FDZ71_11970 [bacterium]